MCAPPWKGLLEPTFREQVHGRVEIRQIFNIAGVGTIAGCYVTEGKIARGNLVRLLRDQVVVHDGKLASLKRFKDDVREVAAGYECGLSLGGLSGSQTRRCHREPTSKSRSFAGSPRLRRARSAAAKRRVSRGPQPSSSPDYSPWSWGFSSSTW